MASKKRINRHDRKRTRRILILKWFRLTAKALAEDMDRQIIRQLNGGVR